MPPKHLAPGFSMHDYPSLAAFVRWRRMAATSLSVRAASAAAFAGKKDTWGALESGRLPRPNLRHMHAISRVLTIAPWPLAIIAGTKPGLKLPRMTQPPWGKWRSGAFIRRVRESSNRSYDVVALAWKTHWPTIPALSAPTAWDILENQGQLPPLPIAPAWAKQPPPTQNLATASGGWWWALLWAVCGDPEWAYYLIPGLAIAAGEVILPIAKDMNAEAYFRHLIDAYQAAYTSHPETFDDNLYFEAAAETARTMRQDGYTIITATQRLLQVEADWAHLNTRQQIYITSLISDLAKKNNT